jgi:hypothetical protein
MSILSPRNQALLKEPEVRNLIGVTLAAGVASSIAGAYLVVRLDPTIDVRKEVQTAVAFALVSGLLSVGYKAWKADKKSGQMA